MVSPDNLSVPPTVMGCSRVGKCNLKPIHGTDYAQLDHCAAVATRQTPRSPLSRRCLLAIVAARLAFNALLGTACARLAAQRGRDAAHRDGLRLLEELWVLLGNLLTLGLSLFLVQRRNGGCRLSSAGPGACLAGWPNHAVDPLVSAYYRLELAWYCHLLLKPVLRYGLRDGGDMMAHHAASLALLLAAVGLNLTRMGLLVLTLFGLSNPLLHAAKLANQLDLRVKVGAFAAFAAVFLATRVLLVPPVVLIPAAVGSWRAVPYAMRDFLPAYVAINALLAALYALQLVWMRAIMRVLVRAATAGADAASSLSAQVDPSKRYAAQVDRSKGYAAPPGHAST